MANALQTPPAVAESGPAADSFAIVTSDTVPIGPSSTVPMRIRGIYVGVSGNIKITTASGNVAVFLAVPQGKILPVQAVLVWANGTTATNLIGLV